MAHEGQYLCQRGCKDRFVSLIALDEHHKNEHSNENHTEFKQPIRNICKYFKKGGCIKGNTCSFAHPQNKKNSEEIRTHMNEYHTGFKQATRNICKYFIEGGCIKGNNCSYTHPQNKTYGPSKQSSKQCRNGSDCQYLYRGVCRFVHSENHGLFSRNYKNTNSNHTRAWCKFMEDCFKVPNCPFKHYEEDFPELKASYNPPTRAKEWDWNKMNRS